MPHKNGKKVSQICRTVFLSTPKYSEISCRTKTGKKCPKFAARYLFPRPSIPKLDVARKREKNVPNLPHGIYFHAQVYHREFLWQFLLISLLCSLRSRINYCHLFFAKKAFQYFDVRSPTFRESQKGIQGLCIRTWHNKLAIPKAPFPLSHIQIFKD